MSQGAVKYTNDMKENNKVSIWEYSMNKQSK